MVRTMSNQFGISGVLETFSDFLSCLHVGFQFFFFLSKCESPEIFCGPRNFTWLSDSMRFTFQCNHGNRVIADPCSLAMTGIWSALISSWCLVNLWGSSLLEEGLDSSCLKTLFQSTQMPFTRPCVLSHTLALSVRQVYFLFARLERKCSPN